MEFHIAVAKQTLCRELQVWAIESEKSVVPPSLWQGQQAKRADKIPIVVYDLTTGRDAEMGCMAALTL
jgi:hypothetical protein